MAKLKGVNGQVLKWARESLGLTVEQVADKLKKPKSLIEAWEAGDDFPTYAQLDKAAYTIYKRPLAVFFFPKPPDEVDIKPDFRLLPEFEVDALSYDTRVTINEALARQESLRELSDGVNPKKGLIFKDINARKVNLADLCAFVRNKLGIDLEEQYSWPNSEHALKQWRSAVQNCGVFVFKTSMKDSTVSGFCLDDPEFPIIYINNTTSLSRQIFTLFHELAHILYSESGFTKFSQSYLKFLPREEREIEVTCNRFASEFLVPNEAFESMVPTYDGSDDSLDFIARKFNVSKEVILRKFLDRHVVTQAFYLEKKNEWDSSWWSARKSGRGGGNYYATQASYLGDAFMSLAFSVYYEGRCSIGDLADHLNVKVQSVSSLEAQVLSSVK